MKKEKKAGVKSLLLGTAEVVAPLLIVLLLNIFVCRLVVVSGDSMYPTLRGRDILMIRVLAYTPCQGDIVVCRTDPEGELGGEQIVKRCIATAGQTVFIDYANNTVTVDGVCLYEDYINWQEADPMLEGNYENAIYVVPEGYIFVLGDNRNHSTDSRDSKALGMVCLEDVIGGMLLHIQMGALTE